MRLSGGSRSRRPWRFWVAVFLLCLVAETLAAVFGVQRAFLALQATTRVDTQGFRATEDALDAVAACCRFDILEWEVTQLARWGALRLAGDGGSADEAGDVAAVGRFFELRRTMRAADLARAQTETAAGKAQAQLRLEEAREKWEALRPRVERVLTAQVSEQLAAAGLSAPLPLVSGVLLPPVAFAIVAPPSVLVISPRTEIRQERANVLEPGLTTGQVATLEHDAEALGWSAIVEPTGGYSAYPTIVTSNASLDFVLQSVAHEWSHTYLFFKPLGFNYFQSRQMRTINETVANIIGREISRQLVPQFREAAAAPETPPATGAKPAFNFRQEMRATRLEAERLLAEGRVETAELYMEERRKDFVRQGYYIRKLNQAYFAFHGTYADTPGSVDPIGPQLKALFERSGSLIAFVQAVEGIGSYQDFQQVLQQYGIAEAPQPSK